jgi:hypothetical protein
MPAILDELHGGAACGDERARGELAGAGAGHGVERTVLTLAQL